MADRDQPAADRSKPPARKDGLIQARVPQELESAIKQEARRRRLSVSHLIRAVLEDSFDLLDGVVADVDRIVSDSVAVAKNMRRRGRRLTSPDPPTRSSTPSAPPSGDLSHVYAWNELVLHRTVACSQCGVKIGRAEKGYAGLSDEPQAERAWLCVECIEDL
jgi:hypothetical protein